jgi:hypothetical protein
MNAIEQRIIQVNPAIGLTEKVIDVLEQKIDETVELASKCSKGYAVLYGGFGKGKVQKNWFEVEYYESIQWLDEHDDYHVAFIIVPCFLDDLIGTNLTERDEYIKNVKNDVQLFYRYVYASATSDEDFLAKIPNKPVYGSRE